MSEEIRTETNNDPNPKKEKKKKSVGQEILEWVITLLVAVIAALAIRSFVFEPVRVDGQSMDDTLANGEIMFVSKLNYGSVWLTLPWQDNAAKEKSPRLAFFGEPNRFDIVICRYPGRGDTNFVKRVIGLPGDTVMLMEGKLYIMDADGVTTCYDEEWISDAYRVRGGSNGRDFGPYKVEDGHYFVMGDHRNNSNDSRSQGAISRDMIIGKVCSVVFPFNAWRSVQAPEASRTGTVISGTAE